MKPQPPKEKDCPDCDGSGNDESGKVCATCDGHGIVDTTAEDKAEWEAEYGDYLRDLDN